MSDITVDLNSIKEFTQEHVATYKRLNPQEAHPWLFGDDKPDSFYLISEAELIDFDDVNWVDSEVGLETQYARAGGQNPELKEIAADIADFGFKLGKPTIALLKNPDNSLVPLNGRTRRLIMNSNYKDLKNFIAIIYGIIESEINADFSYTPKALSDISIFAVSANTHYDPQGTTTSEDVKREVMLAIKNGWITKSKKAIADRVAKLCGKGVFRQETRDKLTQIIYNRYTETDKVLPWSKRSVKLWRKEHDPQIKDVDWDIPKKVNGKYYDGIRYVILSSSTLEKSFGTVAREAKENPTKLIRLVIHTGVLKGAIAEANFLEKVKNFRNVWKILQDNISFAFYKGKPALNDRVSLYGVLPAIQKYHDLKKVIRFVEEDPVDNPYGLEQTDRVLAHTPPPTEEEEEKEAA